MEARTHKFIPKAFTGIVSNADNRRVLDDVWHTIKKEKHWLLLVIPLLLSLYGPIQWLAQQWSQSSDALGFQPLVPLGVAYLVWAERDSFSGTYRGLADIYPEGHKSRRGTPIVAYLGCLILFFSYITTIGMVAVIGFWVTVIGIILHIYGLTVLRALWRPFLFAATMIPVPGSLVDMATSYLQRGCATAAGAVLKLIYPQAHTIGNFISIGSYTAQVSGPCSGVGILLPVMVLTLFLALLRKIRWTITMILLGCAAGISLVMNTIRIVIMGAIGVQNPRLAEQLHDANSWVFTALAFYLTFLLAGRIGPRTYRHYDDEMLPDED
ncbi:MAG: exosortase/archaeosortase family protein [Akkermansiaceae bacterium]|nr:exosortase/archaeosortase family protein [Armatimonadota bacterium]